MEVTYELGRGGERSPRSDLEPRRTFTYHSIGLICIWPAFLAPTLGRWSPGEEELPAFLCPLVPAANLDSSVSGAHYLPTSTSTQAPTQEGTHPLLVSVTPRRGNGE